MTEEQKEDICTNYCRFPFILTQDELEEKCKHCILNEIGETES